MFSGGRSCSQGNSSLQMFCTRLGPSLGGFLCPKKFLWCFYWLTFIFAMILEYYVHGDVCVKYCRQMKMDSTVESDPRNGFPGGCLLLGSWRIALAICSKSHEGGLYLC